jgi:hypothetical protein
MIKNVWKEWKTTIIGIAIAVANSAVNGLSTKEIIISALVAVLGAIAKDPKEDKVDEIK